MIPMVPRPCIASTLKEVLLSQRQLPLGWQNPIHLGRVLHQTRYPLPWPSIVAELTAPSIRRWQKTHKNQMPEASRGCLRYPAFDLFFCPSHHRYLPASSFAHSMPSFRRYEDTCANFGRHKHADIQRLEQPQCPSPHPQNRCNLWAQYQSAWPQREIYPELVWGCGPHHRRR